VKVGRRGRGSWWLAQKERRQHEGITFRPGKNGVVEETAGLLNLWNGFGIKPHLGDWSLMQRHIGEVLAAGNEQHAEYIIRWLAWAVQNPGQRAEVVLNRVWFESGSSRGLGFAGSVPM
jgi:hypothetical protein